jgi:hypothetical protein
MTLLSVCTQSRQPILESIGALADRELDKVDSGRVLLRAKRNEKHSKVVQGAPQIVDNVSDLESPDGIRRREPIDVEVIPPHLLVDFTPDVVRAR